MEGSGLPPRFGGLKLGQTQHQIPVPPGDKENSSQNPILHPQQSSYDPYEGSLLQDRRRAAPRAIHTSTEDMAKLSATFDTLQEQFQLLPAPTRRESMHGEESRALLAFRQGTHLVGSTSTVAPTQSAAAVLQQHAAASNNSSRDQDFLLGSSSAGEEKVLVLPTGHASLRVGKCAAEVFEEAELQKLCDEGLTKQLQRTKDGATEKSRIQELAGTVERADIWHGASA